MCFSTRRALLCPLRVDLVEYLPQPVEESVAFHKFGVHLVFIEVFQLVGDVFACLVDAFLLKASRTRCYTSL
jgi:hypothetical protein